METSMESRHIAPAGAPGTTGGGLGLLARALRALQAAPPAQIDGQSSPPGEATFMVEHAGHIIARGTVTVGSGHLTRGEVPGLPAGAYTLTIMAGHGQTNQVLLRESITLPEDEEPVTR